MATLYKVWMFMDYNPSMWIVTLLSGQLSDCWFLSAMATVSTKPGLIEKLCVARDEKVGIYGFIFCRDGEW